MYFFVLYFRYTLYTKTRLGYMYFKREMRKAREQFPAGHSTAQPMELNGMRELLCQSVSHRRAMVVLLLKKIKTNKKLFYVSAVVICVLSAVVVNKLLHIHTVQQKRQKPLIKNSVFTS